MGHMDMTRSKYRKHALWQPVICERVKLQDITVAWKYHLENPKKECRQNWEKKKNCNSNVNVNRSFLFPAFPFPPFSKFHVHTSPSELYRKVFWKCCSVNSPFLLLQTNNCIARDLWIYKGDIINTPCLTLLPQKPAGLLPIPVAGNLNLRWALLRSTIHLDVSNNPINIPFQHCGVFGPSTPIIPQARKSELELTAQGHSNSDADPPTALLWRLHHTLTVTLNTELLMPTFLAFHSVSCFMIVYSAYFMKSLRTLQYPAAPVAKIQNQIPVQPVYRHSANTWHWWTLFPDATGVVAVCKMD